VINPATFSLDGLFNGVMAASFKSRVRPGLKKSPSNVQPARANQPCKLT
jgi:hypothetical protein